MFQFLIGRLSTNITPPMPGPKMGFNSLQVDYQRTNQYGTYKEREKFQFLIGRLSTINTFINICIACGSFNSLQVDYQLGIGGEHRESVTSWRFQFLIGRLSTCFRIFVAYQLRSFNSLQVDYQRATTLKFLNISISPRFNSLQVDYQRKECATCVKTRERFNSLQVDYQQS